MGGPVRQLVLQHPHPVQGAAHVGVGAAQRGPELVGVLEGPAVVLVQLDQVTVEPGHVAAALVALVQVLVLLDQPRHGRLAHRHAHRQDLVAGQHGGQARVRLGGTTGWA